MLGGHTRTQRPHRNWGRPAFEGLSVSCRGQASGYLLHGQGLWIQQAQEAQCVSPAIEPRSRRPTNRRTIIPRSSHTGTKVLEPITDFPTRGSRKGTENPQGFDFGGQWDLQNFHRTGETDSWGAQTTTCAHQDPEERSSEPTRLS